MTKPRYRDGWAAGSPASEIVPAPAGYAWYVNLNNGNSNRNNQSNHNHVRAVRAGECQPSVSLRNLHTAWRGARRGKKPSADQLEFDLRWAPKLLELQRRLNERTWSPSPPTCFIATKPKAREIHAPAFADRVVHHLLVPPLEAIYERIFIADSYSNRVGKGTHAAVDRLQQFVRQVFSGQGGGWYLQLDVRNFFNSIDRRILYALLKPRMEAAGLSEPCRRAVHALLRQGPTANGVRRAYTERERAAVPAHKRLENAPAGCGLAIGNLSSQFLANVYLNELDQFVKHQLRARRYVRYVDDFVLVHESRQQLAEWHIEIERFLAERLHLSLKPEHRLMPLDRGIDFLGYVVFPTHRVVRRRVISHCRDKLAAWERRHVKGSRIRAIANALQGLRSVWASYHGHFAHASSHRLQNSLHARFRWLAPALSALSGRHE